MAPVNWASQHTFLCYVSEQDWRSALDFLYFACAFRSGPIQDQQRLPSRIMARALLCDLVWLQGDSAIASEAMAWLSLLMRLAAPEELLSWLKEAPASEETAVEALLVAASNDATRKIFYSEDSVEVMELLLFDGKKRHQKYHIADQRPNEERSDRTEFIIDLFMKILLELPALEGIPAIFSHQSQFQHLLSMIWHLVQQGHEIGTTYPMVQSIAAWANGLHAKFQELPEYQKTLEKYIHSAIKSPDAGPLVSIFCFALRGMHDSNLFSKLLSTMLEHPFLLDDTSPSQSPSRQGTPVSRKSHYWTKWFSNQNQKTNGLLGHFDLMDGHSLLEDTVKLAPFSLEQKNK